jgi:NAD(P)-dependent dehydrogenase (short-subunit alcohol dehydrogenase family)
VDLADPARPARLIERTFSLTGRIDLLCSNAGIGRNKRLMKEPLDEAADRLFAVNFLAALRLAQAYLPALESAGMRGRMLITASENSLSVPSAVRGAGLGLYAATKHALLIMAEWLRDELAGTPLDVHVLLPGAVYTPMVARAIPDPAQAPPELALITPQRCAEIALRGLDLGLFYIPTQPHLAIDMRARTQGVADALNALGLHGRAASEPAA